MAQATASHGNAVVTLAGGGGDVWMMVSGEQRESSANMVERKLKTLDNIVFCIAFLEWAGNAVGTLAFLWATAVLLGGFCSLLNCMDFWFSAIMISVEGSRVFIRNDASVNQWLFGSTSAFRWENLSSPRMLELEEFWKVAFAMATGVGIGLSPLDTRPEIVAGLLKVAFLVIISQLLTKQSRGRFAKTFLIILGAAAVCGGIVGAMKMAVHTIKISKANPIVSYLKISGVLISWLLGTLLLASRAVLIVRCVARMSKTVPLLGLKVIILSVLACLPYLQAITAPSYYRYVSISVSIVLLALSYHEFWGGVEVILEKRDSTSSCGLLLQIIDIILPIFFCWSVMFPLPGISLKISFYMLFSVIATVLIANLQIPIAFVQVLLSILRLRCLLGHHHHDYNPLPPDASPNLVPSIVVFFTLALCQGSSYIVATILGFISLFRRRSLVIRDLQFEEEWGEKAINLYFRQAYQARTEKGLLHSGKEKYAPNLKRFAIQSLGCTASHEMQIVGLRILDNYMQRGDSESKKKLITETVKDTKNIITNIVGLISYLIDKENCGESQEEKKKEAEQKKVVSLCLQFVRRLAINGGRISTRFRQELSENPFFLDSLEQILNLEGCQLQLWEPVMGIIAMLALDEGARQEIGVTQSIIRKLMHAFVRPDDVNPRRHNGHSLQMAAGTALVNLTIMNTDNCWAILLADPHHNLLKKLIHMLEGEDYICVAANLLHNLCANSRDKLMDIDFGANVHLETALQKVMQIIRTKEGKQLEAALGVASGYPEYFAQMLESDTDDSAAELIEKLVDTLKSNRKPCPEYPRIRRAIIEVIIIIMESCPWYIKNFGEKGAKDALDMVNGTPSRLEKYRVFLDGEGVIAESLPMRDQVDKAKRLIDLGTPTPGAQSADHA